MLKNLVGILTTKVHFGLQKISHWPQPLGTLVVVEAMRTVAIYVVAAVIFIGWI